MSWVLEQDQLHITIGSSPQVSEALTKKVDLDNELQMIKAALLYAERATLCSPTASVFASFLEMADLSTNEKLAFFEIIPTWFPETSIADQAREAMEFHRRAKARRYTKKGQEDLRKFGRALDETWPTLSDGLRDVITQLGGGEIVSASESGLLDIHRFEAPIERMVVDSKRRSFIEEYVSVVGESVSDKSTYPLFDDQTNSVISAGIAAGVITVSDFGIAHGKEVGLAADLFKRLPLFPRASVKEILDIRRELETPLRRFRGAMLKFSSDIMNSAWDDNFGVAAETVFRQEVAPAILNIEEEVKSNRFMTELTARLAPIGAGTISALGVSMSNLPATAIAALAMGGAGIAAASAVQAYRRWAEKRKATEQNHLYFYYQAGQLISDGTYQYISDRSV